MTETEKRQIEDMASEIFEHFNCRVREEEAKQIATHLVVNAGFRKQREGEWIKVYQNKIATVYECSCCKHLDFATSEYCLCGARMKGGEK